MHRVIFYFALLCVVTAAPQIHPDSLDERFRRAVQHRNFAEIGRLMAFPEAQQIQPSTAQLVASALFPYPTAYIHFMHRPAARFIDVNAHLFQAVAQNNLEVGTFLLSRASPAGIARAALSGNRGAFKWFLADPHVFSRSMELDLMAQIYARNVTALFESLQSNPFPYFAARELIPSGKTLIELGEGDKLIWLMDQPDSTRYLNVDHAVEWLRSAIAKGDFMLVKQLLDHRISGGLLRASQDFMRRAVLHFIGDPNAKPMTQLLLAALRDPIRVRSDLIKHRDSVDVEEFSKSDHDKDCAICLENVSEPSPLNPGTHSGVVLHCDGCKAFHADCLQKWVNEGSSACPNCFANLPVS